MRRSVIVLTATATGLALVLTFRPKEATVAVASSAATSQQATVTKSGASTVATGAPITTQFGTTQVRVTISNGKITDVAAIQINSNEPQSIQISQAAVPTLRQEVLTKQSASVDSVSGATVTSGSYTASLQSALDKAGFKAPDGSTASTQAPVVQGRGGRGHGGFGGLFGGG
jgi:uncharacterized protein with FMN-binding domain